MQRGYYKIIRDKSLKELNEKYSNVLYKKLNKKEFKYYLNLRLKEETVKLLQADSKERFINKLADILETFDYILDENKIDRSVIQKIKTNIKKSKGGFDKRYLLISLEE